MLFHTFYNELVEPQCGVFEREVEDLFFVHTLLGIIHIETQACPQCESNDEPSKSYSVKKD